MRFDIRNAARGLLLPLGIVLLWQAAPLGVARGQSPSQVGAPRRDTVLARGDSVLPPVVADTFARNVGVLHGGDILDVAVYPATLGLDGKYAIDSRGYVTIPGIGMIRAAGLEPPQVTDSIRQAMIERGFRDPQIAVQPLIRVSVLGLVRAPGLQLIDPGTTLIQLITLAGGPLDRADLANTKVIRSGRVFHVDLASALNGDASGRVLLNSNDVVVIPQKHGFSREDLGFVFSALTAGVTALNLILTLTRH